MSLVGDEIKELGRMSKELAAGKITAGYVQSQMKIFKEKRTRYELLLKALISSNKPHLIESRLSGWNILSKGEYMQPACEIEMEMVQCPDRNDKAVTREDCLSFSGATGNTEQCSSCEHFGITRKLLLGKKKS